MAWCSCVIAKAVTSLCKCSNVAVAVKLGIPNESNVLTMIRALPRKGAISVWVLSSTLTLNGCLSPLWPKTIDVTHNQAWWGQLAKGEVLELATVSPGGSKGTTLGR